MTKQDALDLVRNVVPLHEEATLEATWHTSLSGADFWSVKKFVNGKFIEEYVVAPGEVHNVPDIDASEKRIVNKYLQGWLEELDGLTKVVLLQPSQDCELFVENRSSGFEDNVNAWSQRAWAYIECRALLSGYRLELTDGRLIASWAN